VVNELGSGKEENVFKVSLASEAIGKKYKFLQPTKKNSPDDK
jgi:hypothetical protein